MRNLKEGQIMSVSILFLMSGTVFGLVFGTIFLIYSLAMGDEYIGSLGFLSILVGGASYFSLKSEMI